MPIVPDDKDWTWVLRRPCSECGFDAPSVERTHLAGLIRASAALWPDLMGDPDAPARPAADVWSPLEYACHLRDVHRLFLERVTVMLAEDEPRFDNWDQDATAVDDAYGEQEPPVVGRELVEAADAVADLYAAVPDDAWGRRGLRSNGSEFTVESIGRYHLHDAVHHLHDVGPALARRTVAAYDAFAEDYRAGTTAAPAVVTAAMDRFASSLPAGARVLEIGSGPGRDAVALEARGLSVRRTDVSIAFVALMRAEGHRAERVDPLTDDLVDPERGGCGYDGVWACACLLHVVRAELPTVLSRLAAVTVPGGRLHASFKEGDGEEWSAHGHVAAPRFFTYWRERPLHAALEASGWRVEEIAAVRGTNGGPWLHVHATRA